MVNRKPLKIQQPQRERKANFNHQAPAYYIFYILDWTQSSIPVFNHNSKRKLIFIIDTDAYLIHFYLMSTTKDGNFVNQKNVTWI